jgi:multisubunit Na+/H+ antiporter MnhF subunit
MIEAVLIAWALAILAVLLGVALARYIIEGRSRYDRRR